MAIPQRLPPDVRPKIRDHLMEFLYAKDTRMAQDILIGILDKHRMLTGSFTMSFMYMNRVFHLGNSPKPIIAESLHPELYSSMNAYLRDRMAVEREEKLIVKNLLTAVMNVSDSPNDWKQILPAPLHEPLMRCVQMAWNVDFGPDKLTPNEIEIWQNKHEKHLNILKGRLALNLIF